MSWLLLMVIWLLLSRMSKWLMGIIYRHAFNEFVDREKAYNVRDEDIPEHLKCKICMGLLNDATLVPCCKSVFCQDCIRYV
jgi:hypothetical protein